MTQEEHGDEKTRDASEASSTADPLASWLKLLVALRPPGKVGSGGMAVVFLVLASFVAGQPYHHDYLKVTTSASGVVVLMVMLLLYKAVPPPHVQRVATILIWVLGPIVILGVSLVAVRYFTGWTPPFVAQPVTAEAATSVQPGTSEISVRCAIPIPPRAPAVFLRLEGEKDEIKDAYIERPFAIPVTINNERPDAAQFRRLWRLPVAESVVPPSVNLPQPAAFMAVPTVLVEQAATRPSTGISVDNRTVHGFMSVLIHVSGTTSDRHKLKSQLHVSYAS